jgi:hypothetical protein
VPLEDLYFEWITSNHVSLTIEGGTSDKEAVEQISAGAEHQIPIGFLSPDLDGTVGVRVLVVFGCPGDFFEDIATTNNLVWGVSDQGLIIGPSPLPPGTLLPPGTVEPANA